MEQAILQFFESIRCPFLDLFFSVFSFFGEATVMAACVILIYWLAANRTGEQLALTALTSLPVNVVLKCTVSRPRPYAAGIVERVDIDNFFVSTVDLGDNLSFPSGHAQCTTTLLGGISLRARKWWVWAVSAAFVLLVVCSRLYFGVHYPTDLLAGIALGLAVAVFWELVYRYLYPYRYFALFALALLSLVPFFFFVHKDYVQAAGFLSGAAVFLPLCDLLFKRKPAPFPRRLWRIPAGLLIVGGVFALCLLLPAGAGYSLLKWFLFAGGATLGAEALFFWLKI